MLGHEGRRLVAGLTDGVLAVQPLLEALGPPLRAVWSVDGEPSRPPPLTREMKSLLDSVVHQLRAPALELHGGPGSGRPIFEEVVGRRLTLNVAGRPPTPAPTAEELEAAVQGVVATSFGRVFRRSDLVNHRFPLRTYAPAERRGEPLLMVAPCGMPAQLCESWMRALGDRYFVVTWETRGLFGDPQPLEPSQCTVSCQVDDLFAVMDHHRIDRAHVMGTCGGAVIALQAAARRPERIESLSLWHGDYELGGDAPRTDHQRNLAELMTIAGEGRQSAASIRTLLGEVARNSVPREVAHLVLYPFATDELLFRYGLLNGRIMAEDVRPVLERIDVPTLVVTSQDDHTAHPEGSRCVASMLPRCTLHVEPHGDHLSLFQASLRATAVAREFMSSGRSSAPRRLGKDLAVAG